MPQSQPQFPFKIDTLLTLTIGADRHGYRIIWVHPNGRRAVAMACDDNGTFKSHVCKGLRINSAGEWVLDQGKHSSLYQVIPGLARNHLDPSV